MFSILKEITGNYSTLELVRFLALASVSFRRRAARKEFHLREGYFALDKTDLHGQNETKKRRGLSSAVLRF